jgi:hypothetical protein
MRRCVAVYNQFCQSPWEQHGLVCVSGAPHVYDFNQFSYFTTFIVLFSQNNDKGDFIFLWIKGSLNYPPNKLR